MIKKYVMHLENAKGEIVSQEYEIEALDIEQAREFVWDLVIGCEIFAEGKEKKAYPSGKKIQCE